MKTWTYSWIVYPLAYCLALVVGTFKPKVRHTLRLRAWKDFLSLRFNAGTPIEFWIHVASAGELEYAIPLIEDLAKRGKQVLVTYYSVSAKDAVERLRSKYPNVSLVVPLPHDGLGLMKEFVRLVHGQGVRVLLLMKYELWPGMLWECRTHGVKIILVDALRPGWFHQRLLHKLDAVISGYESEVAGVRHDQVAVLGDTRVERVLQRMELAASTLSESLSPEVSPEVSRFLGTRPTLVFGSMWPADDKVVLLPILDSIRSCGFNVVWVPHEIDLGLTAKMQKRFEEKGFACATLSTSGFKEGKNDGGPAALCVARKGILAELYTLGLGAYVGGGFGVNVHSVWEPLIARAWVSCGPHRNRSPESEQLRQAGVLQVLQTSQDAITWVESLMGRSRVPADKLATITSKHLGAARRIIDFAETNYEHSKSHHTIATRQP